RGKALVRDEPRTEPPLMRVATDGHSGGSAHHCIASRLGWPSISAGNLYTCLRGDSPMRDASTVHRHMLTLAWNQGMTDGWDGKVPRDPPGDVSALNDAVLL